MPTTTPFSSTVAPEGLLEMVSVWARLAGGRHTITARQTQTFSALEVTFMEGVSEGPGY